MVFSVKFFKNGKRDMFYFVRNEIDKSRSIEEKKY